MFSLATNQDIQQEAASRAVEKSKEPFVVWEEDLAAENHIALAIQAHIQAYPPTINQQLEG